MYTYESHDILFAEEKSCTAVGTDKLKEQPHSFFFRRVSLINHAPILDSY